MYQELKVGDCFPLTETMGEGVNFVFDEGGLILIYNLIDPSSKEIEQFKTGHRFELRLLNENGVIWVLSKPGNLNWREAPYSPFLHENFQIPEEPEAEKGYVLTIILVNARTNKICSEIRTIGMSANISVDLRNMIIENLKKTYDSKQYNAEIQKMRNMHSIKDLAFMSNSQMVIA